MMNPFKKIIAWDLNRKQAELKKKVERFGLTDEVLDNQVKLNRKRNKWNIPDEDNFIYENFVQ